MIVIVSYNVVFFSCVVVFILLGEFSNTKQTVSLQCKTNHQDAKPGRITQISGNIPAISIEPMTTSIHLSEMYRGRIHSMPL